MGLPRHETAPFLDFQFAHPAQHARAQRKVVSLLGAVGLHLKGQGDFVVDQLVFGQANNTGRAKRNAPLLAVDLEFRSAQGYGRICYHYGCRKGDGNGAVLDGQVAKQGTCFVLGYVEGSGCVGSGVKEIGALQVAHQLVFVLLLDRKSVV